MTTMLKYKHHTNTQHLLQNCQKLYPKQFMNIGNNPFKGFDPVAVIGAIGMAMWASEIEPALKSTTIDMHGSDMFEHVKEDLQIAIAVLGTKFCLPEEQTGN